MIRRSATGSRSRSRPPPLSITPTQPAAGATVSSAPSIQVDTLNFTLDVNTAGGPPMPGVGHYHVYLDGYDSAHLWQMGYYPDLTLSGLPAGEHDLWVRLMNNDHTSIDPKPADKVHLTLAP